MNTNYNGEMHVHPDLPEWSEALKQMEDSQRFHKDLKLMRNLSGWQEFFEHEKSPLWCATFARFVIGEPWPPGEPAIARDASSACNYARFTLEDRWPTGEAAIAGDGYQSYYYALYVIKGPWGPGETVIAKSADYSYCYALYVIKGPWELGEKAILQDGHCRQQYMDAFCLRLCADGQRFVKRSP